MYGGGEGKAWTGKYKKKEVPATKNRFWEGGETPTTVPKKKKAT